MKVFMGKSFTDLPLPIATLKWPAVVAPFECFWSIAEWIPKGSSCWTSVGITFSHGGNWRQLVASGASAAIFPLDNLSPYSEVYRGLQFIVVWNIFYFSIYIYTVLGMSSSQLTFIFFRGVGIPPTSLQYFTISCRIVSPCWTTILDGLISMCGYIHVWVLYTNGPCSIGYIQ